MPIWVMRVGDALATMYAGDAAGLANAKAYIAAGPPGVMQIGPGHDALAYGASWTDIALVQTITGGGHLQTRLRVADATDPTKRMLFDPSGITTGTERTATFPDYSGLVLLPASLGSSGQFLKSNGAGVQPTWAAPTVTNALLDGSNHTDTVVQAAVRGHLIVGVTGAPPKWDRLAIGSANTVLFSNGTDPSWVASSTIAALTQHDLLLHLKPVQAANCSWTTGTLTITSVNLANVRIGDYVYLGDNTGTANQGRRVTGLGAGSVTVDAVNGNGTITNQTFVFFPGDHWDDTMVLDSATTGGGLFCSAGRGTYTTSAGGTFQEIQGPVRWKPHASGALVSDFRVQGSQSTVTPSGFAIDRFGTTNRCYFHATDLTAVRTIKLPDIDGFTIVVTDGSQVIRTKNFDSGNRFRMEPSSGAGNGCAFVDAGDNTKALRLDMSGIATGTGRVAKVADLDAAGPIQYAYVSQTTAIDGKSATTTNLYTVPSGKNLVVTRIVVRCTAATAIATGPSFGIGIAAGEDDIVTSAAHATFVAANTFVFCTIKDPAVVATSTQVIKLGIDTGATGTSMTLAVEVAGYLV